jgi:hypothetical protein
MLFKNVVLIWALVNIEPETRYNANWHMKIMYAVYEAAMPTFLALAICVPAMLLSKERQGYQTLNRVANQVNRFHIAIFIGVPVFTYLLADALSCSGIDTLIAVGLLHNLYAQYNLTAN